MDMEEKEIMKDSSKTMTDINFRAIAENLTRHGIEVSQDVKDMIDTYGKNPMDNPFEADNYIRNFITVTYKFITDVLSGVYDISEISKIPDQIVYVSSHPKKIASDYVRGISAGGSK